MVVTVFGANGQVGRLVVAELLQRKLQVVAFVHRNNPFEGNPNVRTVSGSIYDAEAVAGAVKGSDAVISTLGSWHTPKKDILSSAMTILVPALEQAGPRRIVTLTGADARSLQDRKTVVRGLLHTVFATLAPKIMADAEKHMSLLQTSGLDWTVVRSPVMRSKPTSQLGHLSPEPPRPWEVVCRQDVARLIVDELLQPQYIQKAPFVRSY